MERALRRTFERAPSWSRLTRWAKLGVLITTSLTALGQRICLVTSKKWWILWLAEAKVDHFVNSTPRSGPFYKTEGLISHFLLGESEKFAFSFDRGLQVKRV